MKKRFTAGRVPETPMDSLFTESARRQAWLDVEGALAAAQAAEGVIPAAAGEAVVAACRVDLLDAGRVDAAILRTSHPLMGLVVELADLVGPEHGGWVHWGATTQNITQTGDTLLLTRARAIVADEIRRIVVALAGLAERSADLVMPGRTHGQHAVPITFGFKVAAWIDEYLRHLDRLEELRPRLAVALLGGAAGTSAALGESAVAVQRGVAERLGLRPMTVPSRVVVDHAVEFVTLLGMVATTTGRLARELYQLMKTEYGEAEEPVPAGTVGSSTMPHKRNPQLCQDIIGLTAQVRASVPLAFEFALGEHESDNGSSELFDVQRRACELSGEALVRVRVIAEGVVLHPERMRRNLDLTGGLIASEAVMMALAGAVGRQDAHEIVYEAAQAAATGAGSFTARLAADPRIAAALDASAIAELLAPESHIGRAAEIAREQAARGRAVGG